MMETRHLSEKLSRLSTTATTTTTTTTGVNDKETLLKDIQIDLQTIPDYLTKRNQCFQQMINPLLASVKLNDKDNMEALRQISILIYKIMFIQLYQQLWTNYLKAGVGQLITQTLPYRTNRPIWPNEIKTMVKATMKIDEENEYEICFNFVQYYIEVFEQQLKIYQHELNMRANNFDNYSLTIQEQLGTYLEHHLTPLRQEIEHHVALIHYDYHIHAIKLAYFEQKPNPFQEQLMKDVCVSQYEYKTCEQEFNYLKQQIRYYTTSPNHSFEQSKLASSATFKTIQDLTIRQQLLQQLKQTAEQARTEIFNHSLKTAEEQRDDYKQKYDVLTEKLYSTRKSSIEAEKLSNIMIDLIVLRCKKISERIECIYKFKT